MIAERVEDVATQGDLLTTLGIFGKLVYPNLDPFGLIGREHMKESKFYQEIMEEGRLETKRADIIEGHFGSEVGAEFRKVLEDISDFRQLSELLRLAIRSRRPAAFRREFGSVIQSRSGS